MQHLTRPVHTSKEGQELEEGQVPEVMDTSKEHQHLAGLCHGHLDNRRQDDAEEGELEELVKEEEEEGEVV
eukprot:scaffold229860_cov22-Tisochrysis_lutea.AAC.2